MKAIQIRQHGGPEVLELVDVELREPDPNEAVVRVAAAGVNFIEVYQRTGLYPLTLPFTPGQEAAGIVEQVGKNVHDFKPGDRVAYAGVAGGSYAASNVVPASRMVNVPEAISLKHAAAVMLQGMTAHYLARTTFPLKEGDVCVVHAAAGGVGLLLCQIASMMGATVIGTTSTEAKAELARGAGAQHIILYTHENVPERVRSLTNGRGADVVYDSVGKNNIPGQPRITPSSRHARVIRPVEWRRSAGRSTGIQQTGLAVLHPSDARALHRRTRRARAARGRSVYVDGVGKTQSAHRSRIRAGSCR